MPAFFSGRLLTSAALALGATLLTATAALATPWLIWVGVLLLVLGVGVVALPRVIRRRS